jgi:hypothetical protein
LFCKFKFTWAFGRWDFGARVEFSVFCLSKTILACTRQLAGLAQGGG